MIPIASIIELVQKSPLPQEQKDFWIQTIPTSSKEELKKLSDLLTATSIDSLDQMEAAVIEDQKQRQKKFDITIKNGIKNVYHIAEETQRKEQDPEVYLQESLAKIP